MTPTPTLNETRLLQEFVSGPAYKYIQQIFNERAENLRLALFDIPESQREIFLRERNFGRLAELQEMDQNIQTYVKELDKYANR